MEREQERKEEGREVRYVREERYVPLQRWQQLKASSGFVTVVLHQYFRGTNARSKIQVRK